MTQEGPGEVTTEGGPVVIEDDEAERQRKAELDRRVAESGIEGGEDEGARGGGFGTAATLVAEARKHIGTRETGENDTPFNRWLGKIAGYPVGGFGYPWCHAFVSYCLSHSDNAGAGPKTASCSAGVQWFTQRGRWSSTPQVGDLVYYGAGGGTHVEIVAGVDSANIRTIGGNTSGALGGNYFNGDGVYEKTVERSSYRIHGYGRPSFGSGGGAVTAPARTTASVGTAAGVKPITTVRPIKQQQQAVNGLGYAPPLDVDGEWGPKTAAGVKWLQTKIGAGSDGQWGQETEQKYVAFAK